MYWIVSQDALLEGNIVSSPSTSGDDCHADINSISKSGSKRLFPKIIDTDSMFICIDEQSRALQLSDLE